MNEVREEFEKWWEVAVKFKNGKTGIVSNVLREGDEIYHVNVLPMEETEKCGKSTSVWQHRRYAKRVADKVRAMGIFRCVELHGYYVSDLNPQREKIKWNEA